MKRIITASLLLLIGPIGFSQEIQNENLENFQEKKILLGFNIGINYSNIKPVQQPPLGSSVSNKPGVRLGILSEYQPVDWFSVIPKMEVSFNGAALSYAKDNNETVSYEVNPVTLEIAPHFKFKKKTKGANPYCFAGPNIRLALNNSDNPSQFKSRNSISLDFGIGLDKNLSIFKFAPELRYSYGLMNVNGNPVFQDVRYHNIALIFNFLG